MKIRISAVPVPLTVLAALLFLPVRSAAQSVLAVRCADVTLDAASRIQACTAIIRDGASNDMELAVAYTSRGSALDQNGDYKAAIRDFDAALESQPDYAPAFNNRGSAHLSLRQYDRAIPDFDEAIRISPKSAVYYSNRGAASEADDKPTALARHFVRMLHRWQTNRTRSPHRLRSAPSDLPAANLVARGVAETVDQGYKLENVCSQSNHTKFLRPPM